MEVRFLKTVKLTIQKGNEETVARYRVGDIEDFEEEEVYTRLVLDGLAYPTHGHGGPVPLKG